MKINKESAAVLVGILLIFFVAVFTFIRSEKKSDTPDSSQKNAEVVATYKTISPVEIQKKIKNDEDFQIIDIREFDDYILEHIIDATNVPLTEIDSFELMPGKKVILFAGTNEATFLNQTVAAFEKKDAGEVMVLDVDIDHWKAIGGQTLTYGDPTKASDQSKVNYISQENLKAKIDAKENIFIIDVREKEKFEKGHLSKALNVPLPDIEKRRFEIPLSKTIVIYTDIEIEAFQAAVRLYDAKFITASVLKEGYTKWLANNYPTE